MPSEPVLVMTEVIVFTGNFDLFKVEFRRGRAATRAKCPPRQLRGLVIPGFARITWQADRGAGGQDVPPCTKSPH